MLLLNTCFKRKEEKLITYSSGGCQSQIDFIITSNRNRKLVKNTKVIPGEAAFTQHRLVVSDLSIPDNLKQVKKPLHKAKLRVWKLKDPEVKANYQREVAEAIKANPLVSGVGELWSCLKDSLTTATEKTCGRSKGGRKNRATWWWNSEVEEAIKEKRKAWKAYRKKKGSREAYTTANKKAKHAVYLAKRAAETQRFGDLSTDPNSRKNVFKMAKQIKGQNADIIGDPCIRNNKGDMAFSDTEKLEAWKEHYETLLNEEFKWNESQLIWEEPISGPAPQLSKKSIQEALAKMHDGKAAGGSGVVAEMLKCAGEEGIDLITDLFNAIIKENKIPEDWDKSIILNRYKGKGDATTRGNYRGLKLLEHAMKAFERILEGLIRKQVNIDDMQFGFMPGRGTTDAIFIARQVQEKFIARNKTLYLAFIDLEKAFDRVPRTVVKWALRKVGVEEWLISTIMCMYENCKSAVSVNGTVGDPFSVKVGVHQGSVLSPLLFIIVMDALSREFRTGLPWELLYADDLVLISDSIKGLEKKFSDWKKGMEEKGLRVNVGKTKVMISSSSANTSTKSGKYPCGVCSKGVGNNSIFCKSCKSWVHGRCSGIKGKLTLVSNFACPKCSGLISPGPPPADKIQLDGSELEVVNKFCYLGDMLDAKGGSESSSIARVQSGWKKFRDLLPFMDSRGVSLAMKGEIYSTCVRPSMLHAAETWPMRQEEKDRLQRAESSMMRWMCGSKPEDRVPTSSLRSKLGGVPPITDQVRRSRLRWFGHVERRDEDDWLRKACNLDIGGKVPKGRPRQTWAQTVKADLKDLGINKDMAQDRKLWRAVISGESNPLKAVFDYK